MFWTRAISSWVGLLTCWASVAQADFFKWDVRIYPEGYGLTFETVVVEQPGLIYRSESWNCEVADPWTQMTAELLLESKTLRCSQGEIQREVTVTCDLNNHQRRHNYIKEQLLPAMTGFHLEPNNKVDSVYLQLRCYY